MKSMGPLGLEDHWARQCVSCSPQGIAGIRQIGQERYLGGCLLDLKNEALSHSYKLSENTKHFDVPLSSWGSFILV